MCGHDMHQTTSVQTETKFLRLRHPVELGSRFGEWCVCWLGGWDKGRVYYVVMLMRGFYKPSSRAFTEAGRRLAGSILAYPQDSTPRIGVSSAFAARTWSK